MAWEQGNRVRISVEDPKDGNYARNGLIVWVVNLVHEQKSLGFLHPKAEADEVARYYEVVSARGVTFKIWGVYLEAIDGSPVDET
jgi:hypothetical protein